MEFLHTMIRVSDVDASLDFYCNKLGLMEFSRKDYENPKVETPEPAFIKREST